MLKSIKRLLILAIATAAVVLPAAGYARPILPDRQPYSVSGPTAAAATVAPTRSHPVSAGPSQAFSWHDAAFGAAAMLVLVGVGTVAALAVRRRVILS